jgi:hypothetical protein
LCERSTPRSSLAGSIWSSASSRQTEARAYGSGTVVDMRGPGRRALLRRKKFTISDDKNMPAKCTNGRHATQPGRRDTQVLAHSTDGSRRSSTYDTSVAVTAEGWTN